MSILNQPIKLWLRGLMGAALNSIGNGIVVVIVDPTTFNLFHGGAKELAAVVITSMILGAGLYLKTHPLPLEDTVSVVGR